LQLKGVAYQRPRGVVNVVVVDGVPSSEVLWRVMLSVVRSGQPLPRREAYRTGCIAVTHWHSSNISAD
jgi:hypothetical protein